MDDDDDDDDDDTGGEASRPEPNFAGDSADGGVGNDCSICCSAAPLGGVEWLE